MNCGIQPPYSHSSLHPTGETLSPISFEALPTGTTLRFSPLTLRAIYLRPMNADSPFPGMIHNDSLRKAALTLWFSASSKFLKT